MSLRLSPLLAGVVCACLVLAACTPSPTVTVAPATPAGEPTRETPRATEPPPTATAPAEKPTEKVLPQVPVLEGTPIPSVTLAPITARNASGLARLARWGKGTLVDLLWASEDEYYVATRAGIEAYRLPGPAPRLRIESRASLYSAVLTPDRGRLIGGAKDMLYEWDAGTGELTAAIYAEGTGIIQLMAISPAGDWLAVGLGNRIQIWGLPLRPAHTLDTAENLSALAFSPDGRWLASASAPTKTGESITLWDTQTWSEALSIAVNVKDDGYDSVRQMIFPPDGEQLIVNMALYGAGEDLRIYSTRTGELESVVPGSELIFGMALSQDGEILAGAHWRHGDRDAVYIQCWDWRRGAALDRLQDKTAESLNTMAFSPDGQYLLTGTDRQDGVRLWNLEARRLEAKDTGYYPDTLAADIAPDGRAVAAALFDERIELRDARTGTLTAEYQAGALVFQVRFSPDGRYLAAPLDYAGIDILDGSTLDVVTTLEAAELESVSSIPVAFTPDGRYLLAGGDGALLAWEVGTWQQSPDASLDISGSARLLAVSADGRLAAIGLESGGVQVWDWPAQELAVELDYDNLKSLAISGDGNWLAVATYDNLLAVLSASSGYSEIYRSEDGASLSIVFAPDDSFMFTGRNFYSPAGEMAVLGVPGLSEAVRPCLSADGRMLLTYGADGTLSLWGVIEP